jgi:hypothetical protein
VHRLPDTPVAGTRLPTLVVDGWSPGHSDPSPHVVPSPGSRWTLLLTHAERPAVDEHRARLAAESVTAVVVAGSPRIKAAVLVDPLGVVQHVADDVEDALLVIAAFRMGMLDPISVAHATPLRRSCGAEGRHRSRYRSVRRRAA